MDARDRVRKFGLEITITITFSWPRKEFAPVGSPRHRALVRIGQIPNLFSQIPSFFWYSYRTVRNYLL